MYIIGEELFVSYGPTYWEDRKLEYIHVQNNSLSLETIRNTTDPAYIPGCLHKYTVIYNGGVYARQYIPKGTVIEVARGIIYDNHLFEKTSVDLFHWRSKYKNQTMLVLGHGALYRPAKTDEIANVQYEWFVNSTFDVGRYRVDDSGFVSVWVGYENVPCDRKMLIKFTTTRDVYTYDELTINLSLLYKLGKLVPLERFADFGGNCF